MGAIGSVCRTFYFGLNKTNVIGLDRFLEVLDSRKDVEGRQRGLITGTMSLSLPQNVRLTLNSFKSCLRVRCEPTYPM